MDAKTIAVSVVSIAIACLFAVTLLIPVIADSTAETDTFKNEGYYYMTDLGEQSVVYTFDGTKWTIDGEDANITPSDDTTLIAGEEVIVRTNGLIRGKANLTPESLNITVTADGISGTAVVSGNSQSVSISATIYYCAVNEKTDFTLCKYNKPVYVHEDSEFLADGMSSYKSKTAALFRIEGSIKDGFTVTPTPNTLGITDVQCNYVEVDGYEDLYLVSSITFKSVYDNETSEDTTDDIIRDQTYSSYVVPAEVTAERSIHPDANTSVILNLIPLLVIVGIILGTVGFIAFRK